MRVKIAAWMLLSAVLCSRGLAQAANEPCGAPPPILKTAQPNIFSEQQEQWLGDAMADQVERQYRPVKNKAQNEYLQTIGERLLAVLPPTRIQFRFILVDSPEINGFSLAGGRVYLTRKLVAAAQNEDEVAGVIAHEMGHILTHQFGIETTADLKRLLGVTSVSDKADVYAKFQRLVDARMRDKHSSGGDTDEKQDQADRVSVYAAATAGYRPQAFAEFFDRAFYVGGKTGGRVSDFFKMTHPDERRLRAIRGLIAAMPAGCGAAVVARREGFDRWHELVIANQAGAVKDGVNSVAEVKLTPPLRLQMDQIRFSRDGKRLLAQDESSIFVLERDPLRLLFRFDGDGAEPAQFSPDSQQIDFSTPELHVEQWSIAEQKLVAAHEVNIQDGCVQNALSPDGRTLICVRWGLPGHTDNMMNLELVDVATNQMVMEKKSWFQPSFSYMLMMAYSSSVPAVPLNLSQDGNTVLVGPGEVKLAFDLKTRMPIKLGGALKGEPDTIFRFAGDDRVFGVNPHHPKNSGMFSFPEGKRLTEVEAAGDVEPVSRGDWGILQLKDGGVALGSLTTGKMVSGWRRPAMDVWESTAMNENGDGSLVLHPVQSIAPKDIQQLELPLSPLGPLRSAHLSPDGRYLAFSVRARGGVWDTKTGAQIALMVPFRRSWWAKDNLLLMEFPEVDKKPAHIGLMTMPVRAVSSSPHELEKDAHLESGHLVEWKNTGKQNWLLNVRDAQTDAVLWSQSFSNGQPAYTNNLDDDLIFSYPLSLGAAKDKLRANATLDAQARALKYKDAGRLIEVVDIATGAVRRQVVVQRPQSYAGVDGYVRVGDLLYLSVGDNRTIVYSATTGLELRQIFGTVVVADSPSEVVCSVNRRGEATIYDKNGAEMQHLELGSPVRFARFVEKGTRLLVLTADQRVRTFEAQSPGE